MLTLLVSVVGLYVVVALLGQILFRHTLAERALQAIAVTFAAGPFFGPARARHVSSQRFRGTSEWEKGVQH